MTELKTKRRKNEKELRKPTCVIGHQKLNKYSHGEKERKLIIKQ